VCVCSLRYPSRSAHAPYCHLWPAPLYNIFPHYLINGTIFEERKITEHKMCVFIFCTNYEKRFSFWEELGEVWLKMYIGMLHVKYRLFLLDFNETWIFFTDFWKNSQIWNFMKIRPVEADIFPYRQTDRHDVASSRWLHFCEEESLTQDLIPSQGTYLARVSQ
jgi:hypothetical protein